MHEEGIPPPVESIEHDAYEFFLAGDDDEVDYSKTLEKGEQDIFKEIQNYKNLCAYLDGLSPAPELKNGTFEEDVSCQKDVPIFPDVDDFCAGSPCHFWPYDHDASLTPYFGAHSSMRWPLRWYELKASFKRFCYQHSHVLVASPNTSLCNVLFEKACQDTFEQIYDEVCHQQFSKESGSAAMNPIGLSAELNEQLEDSTTAEAADDLLSVLKAEHEIDFEINCAAARTTIVHNTISRLNLFLTTVLFPETAKSATKIEPFTYRDVLSHAKASNLFSKKYF